MADTARIRRFGIVVGAAMVLLIGAAIVYRVVWKETFPETSRHLLPRSATQTR